MLVAMADPRLAEIEARLARFRDERDWRQFHSLSNLAAAVTVEAGELLDLFLWSPPRSEGEVLEGRRDAVEEELADVLIHCLNFASAAEIDVLAAIERKVDKNAQRYPVDLSKGRADKHSEL